MAVGRPDRVAEAVGEVALAGPELGPTRGDEVSARLEEIIRAPLPPRPGLTAVGVNVTL